MSIRYWIFVLGDSAVSVISIGFVNPATLPTEPEGAERGVTAAEIGFAQEEDEIRGFLARGYEADDDEAGDFEAGADEEDDEDLVVDGPEEDDLEKWAEGFVQPGDESEDFEEYEGYEYEGFEY